MSRLGSRDTTPLTCFLRCFAGFKVPPRAGMLLAWNNMNPDGTPNTLTLHEGTAVVEGTKYVVTKWFREGRWTKY